MPRHWIVADSLSTKEQLFCSHLDSYSHYLREYGEDASMACLSVIDLREHRPADVLFALDKYDECIKRFTQRGSPITVAQVAAICNPMPWDVRRADGSSAYDLVISSIPWMVEEARTHGCRAEFMPLAFDTRALVCGMGVKRTRGAIFIGTMGPNHVRRSAIISELQRRGIVEVLPPVWGRNYFRALASARVVVNVHAEWARGAANAMRLYESVGMGCMAVSDGTWPSATWWRSPDDDSPDAWQEAMRLALLEYDLDIPPDRGVFHCDHQTYVSRIPHLVDLVNSVR